MSSPGGTHHYKAYNRASHTVAKTRQVVMLYDGVIRLLRQAAEAMEQRQIETRYHKLTRASEVLNGLQACIDFSAGGQAAQILYDFYAAIDLRLHNLHRTNDKDACLALVDELKQMRDAWDKIDRAAEAGTTAATSATPGADAVTVSA